MRSVDMRYRYQVHELNVPFPAGTSEIDDAAMEHLYALFDELYERAYGQGSAYREAGKEIITFRVSAVGELRKPALERAPVRPSDSGPALKDTREVYFEDLSGFTATPIYDFDRLTPGMELAGPALIETPVTTVVINPKDTAQMDGLRNIVVNVSH